jgi:hypothetical protein
MELSGESPAGGHSAFSTSDIELVLVGADDLIDAACRLVLVVSSDSRLLRNTSWLRTLSFGLMALAS